MYLVSDRWFRPLDTLLNKNGRYNAIINTYDLYTRHPNPLAFRSSVISCLFTHDPSANRQYNWFKISGHTHYQFVLASDRGLTFWGLPRNCMPWCYERTSAGLWAWQTRVSVLVPSSRKHLSMGCSGDKVANTEAVLVLVLPLIISWYWSKIQQEMARNSATNL